MTEINVITNLSNVIIDKHSVKILDIKTSNNINIKYTDITNISTIDDKNFSFSITKENPKKKITISMPSGNIYSVRRSIQNKIQS